MSLVRFDPHQSDPTLCDMTVNPHVLKERSKKSGRPPGEWSHRGMDPLRMGLGLSLIVWLFLCWWFGAEPMSDFIRYDRPPLVRAWDSMAFPLLIAVLGMQLFLQVRPHPTNIILDALGLSLGWRSERDQYSCRLPWADLESVEFRPAPGAACDDPRGGVLLLSYRGLGGPWWSRPVHHDFNSLAFGSSLTTMWRLAIDGRLQLAIPLDVFTLENDMDRFVRYVGEHVAGQKDHTIDPAFAALIGGPAQVSYTRMWLDDMGSFRRRREGALPQEAVVCDGRYRIEQEIARGGQARIYRAEDLESKSAVILKEFVLPVDAGAETRERSFASVKNEALLLARLDHPGIVRLLDHFVEDHRAYLVMQDVEGRSIKKMVQGSGPLSLDAVTAIARQMLDILEYLHGLPSPVVHRDISPDNIMVSDDGRVMLLDFNVARELESSSTRTVVGKHNYMAPEQFKGRANCQSDLYGLGATLYYAITGREPRALMQSVLQAGEINAGSKLEPKIARLIADLTALDCESRCKDAVAARCRLDDVAGDTTGDDGLDQSLDGGRIKLLAREFD